MNNNVNGKRVVFAVFLIVGIPALIVFSLIQHFVLHDKVRILKMERDRAFIMNRSLEKLFDHEFDDAISLLTSKNEHGFVLHDTQRVMGACYLWRTLGRMNYTPNVKQFNPIYERLMLEGLKYAVAYETESTTPSLRSEVLMFVAAEAFASLEMRTNAMVHIAKGEAYRFPEKTNILFSPFQALCDPQLESLDPIAKALICYYGERFEEVVKIMEQSVPSPGRTLSIDAQDILSLALCSLIALGRSDEARELTRGYHGTISSPRMAKLLDYFTAVPQHCEQ